MKKKQLLVAPCVAAALLAGCGGAADAPEPARDTALAPRTSSTAPQAQVEERVTFRAPGH